MPDPGYSWHVGDLRTGRLTAGVPFSEASWQSIIDDAGTLSFAAALTDPAVRKLDLYTSAEPCRCFLAVSYTDAQGTETFLEGGPIWTHTYDSDSSRLTVAGTGLWALWDHRKILPVLAVGTSPATVTTSFSAASLGDVARGLVALAMTHTGGDVPVVLPAVEGGTTALTYAGADLDVVGQELRALSTTDGGPEIQFVPRRRADDPRYIEWVMLVGTAAAPLLVQNGDDLLFDHTVPRSQVTSLSVVRDGSKAANRWWTQGAGTDVSTKFGRADDTTQIDAGFPLLEGNDSNTDEDSQATLDGNAAAGLTANRRPIDTYTISAHRDGVEFGPGDWRGPNAGACRIGSWVSLTVGGWADPADRTMPKEPYLAADGEPRVIRGRITNISGDHTPSMKLGLAPVTEGSA